MRVLRVLGYRFRSGFYIVDKENHILSTASIEQTITPIVYGI